jgi:hypothetical protein
MHQSAKGPNPLSGIRAFRGPELTHKSDSSLGRLKLCLHMCEVRGGYYWKAKERRESGEGKREFEEILKRDWLEFDRRRKR